ncbi:transketolase family protein [Bradyrhizobium cenepequi]|uniref:transketolase family protein n=1 Tax=Bradyrhizobium cenepequi TaxID=2821403 RepID=UPI001CE30BA5|nr:transketolase C-terminal domain-containing protein [Bradyrhizobium cenepequi]MCA6112783.1 transketolase [Bradyrhizobium cenepequi]
MRNAFINSLYELAAARDDIFLLCGDLGYSVLEVFADRFPDRFLNVGVAEQNMTEVAAGLAREGYNVFTYSIGNFSTLRAMEQIRYDVCYHEASVKVVAVGAGYAYGPQGVSHHATEDIAMLRAIPNLTVCAPADPVEARAAAYFMASHCGPGYVRINKTGEASIHDPATSLDFAPGRLLPVQAGNDVAILATGAIVAHALLEVRAAGKSWSVFSVPFVGGYDPAQLREIAQAHGLLVTMEEHQLNGGFGSSIVEALSDMYAVGNLPSMPRVRRIAIPNCFIGTAGSQDYLRATAGLTLASLRS